MKPRYETKLWTSIRGTQPSTRIERIPIPRESTLELLWGRKYLQDIEQTLLDYQDSFLKWGGRDNFLSRKRRLGELAEVEFANMKLVLAPNSHSAPNDCSTSDWKKPETKKLYLAMEGRIRLALTDDLPYRLTDALKKLRIHTGTGGGGATSRSYYVLLWANDFPNLFTQEITRQMLLPAFAAPMVERARYFETSMRFLWEWKHLLQDAPLHAHLLGEWQHDDLRVPNKIPDSNHPYYRRILKRVFPDHPVMVCCNSASQLPHGDYLTINKWIVLCRSVDLPVWWMMKGIIPSEPSRIIEL